MSDKLVMAESKEDMLIFGLEDWSNEIFCPGVYWVREQGLSLVPIMPADLAEPESIIELA